VLEFVKRAPKQFPTLETIIIYGSFPKDEYDDRSDVDTLLIFRESAAEKKYRADVIKLGNRIIRDLEEGGERTWDFQFLITSNMEELDKTLKSAIHSDGIVIYGRPRIDRTELAKHVLFKYSVKGMPPVEKVMFYRALKQSGLSDFRVGNALLVPAGRAKGADSLLMKFKIEKSKLSVYLE
jgi:predicted nucleotidyltransferase